MSLAEWRRKLDCVDGSIVESVEKRKGIVAGVARAKKEIRGEGGGGAGERVLRSGDIVRSVREKEVLSRFLLEEGGELREGGSSFYGIGRLLIATGYREQGLRCLRLMAGDEEVMGLVREVALCHFGMVMGIEACDFGGLRGIEESYELGLYGVPFRGDGVCWWEDVWREDVRPYVRGVLPQVRLSGGTGEGSFWWTWCGPGGKGIEEGSVCPPVWLVTNFRGQEEELEGDVMILGLRCVEGENFSGDKARDLLGAGEELLWKREACVEGEWHGLWGVRGMGVGFVGEVERGLEERRRGVEFRVLGSYPYPIACDGDVFFGSEGGKEDE